MAKPIRFHCSKCDYSSPQFKEIIEHYENNHANKPDPRTERELDDLKAMQSASRIKG